MYYLEKILDDVDEYMIEKQKKKGVELPISISYDFDDEEYFLYLGKYFYGWLSLHRQRGNKEGWGYCSPDYEEYISSKDLHPQYDFLCTMKGNPNVPDNYFVEFNKEVIKRLSGGYSIKLHKTLCYSLRITFRYYFLCIKFNNIEALPEEMILNILSFINIRGLTGLKRKIN